MVYTVYKGVGLGMRAVAADIHDTAQAVTDDIMRYRFLPSTILNLSTLESESRRVPSNRYTQNCAQIPYRFQRPQIRRDVCCLLLNAAL